MKKKLIFIHFGKFLNDFDWKRYELDFFEKKYQVEVHQLLNLTFGRLAINYPSYLSKNNILNYNSYKDWKRLFLNQKNKSSIVIFLSFPFNFTSLKCYLFIKSLKIKCGIVSLQSMPIFSDTNYHIQNNNFFKLLSFFFRPKQTIASLKNLIIFSIFDYFKKKVLSNSFFLGVDSKEVKKKFLQFNRYSKIIRINSWDYSFFLRKERKLQFKKKYILFVSDGEARYPSDSSFLNSRRLENSAEYCKSINNFLNKISSFYNLEVKIAAHPRSIISNKIDKELGSRYSYLGHTEELVRRSHFIITCGSTSISYAIIHKKPILFFYSKMQQGKNIPHLKRIKYYSNLTGSQLINIDNFNEINTIDLNINSKLYQNFYSKYVCKKKNKPNYQLILNGL